MTLVDEVSYEVYTARQRELAARRKRTLAGRSLVVAAWKATRFAHRPHDGWLPTGDDPER